MTNHFPRGKQHGFSMIEIMVGVVIGMIAVLVIYQVFATSEGIKRNITAAGDAQQNGLLSSFMMGIELANAGNGLAVAAQDLGTCTPARRHRRPIRCGPIPLLITDGGGADNPDSFCHLLQRRADPRVSRHPSPAGVPALITTVRCKAPTASRRAM